MPRQLFRDTFLMSSRSASTQQSGHVLADRQFRYKRHCAETTLLYRRVERHRPDFKAMLSARGKQGPCCAVRDFDDYLKCGRLEHSFLRVRCDTCHHEKLVAFSFKRRGFCQSCGARRMVDLATHLMGALGFTQILVMRARPVAFIVWLGLYEKTRLGPK